MPTLQTQAIFSTPPIGQDGKFVLAWLQFFQDVVQKQAASPKAYTLTHSQRLALVTANLTAGSIVFETDTGHVDIWNGGAWVQLA